MFDYPELRDAHIRFAEFISSASGGLDDEILEEEIEPEGEEE